MPSGGKSSATNPRQELPIDLLPKLLYTIGNITGNITGNVIFPDNKHFFYRITSKKVSEIIIKPQ
jgi:hypothetical protein